MKKAGVKITDRVRYRYGSMNAVLKGDKLEKVDQYYPDNHFYYVEMMTQDEYNRIEKKECIVKGTGDTDLYHERQMWEKTDKHCRTELSGEKRTVRDDEPAEEHGRNV